MADGFSLFSDRSIVAMRVNGELRDLAAEVTGADTVEPVVIDSEDGLNILRHSAAHVLAQAVQRINPGVASTLTSITPVLLIPFAFFIKKETVRMREVIGTVVTLVGIGIMFM